MGKEVDGHLLLESLLMELPIIVDAKGDLLVFESVEALSAYIEPIDVEAGEYPGAFDAIGRPLELSVHGKRSFFRDTRIVALKPLDAPPQPDKLAKLILDFLLAVGEKIEGEIVLDQLVERVRRFRTA